MFIKPFLTLLRRRQVGALIAVNALFKPFYRLTFLAAAKECGLLDQLATRPSNFVQLAAMYCQDASTHAALQAWLQLGVRLGLLQQTGERYTLRGMAKLLAQPRNDAALALAQEVAGLHHKLILQTPAKLQQAALWQLSDQDGSLIARSSRIFEALQVAAIDRLFPEVGAVRLLEIGCGAGFYIQYAASRNPALAAVGLELQPDVAALAQRQITAAGLGKRVRIAVGDIRDQTPDAPFDIATLYNNIYYFPVSERVALLRYVRRFLRPGGRLLLTTCCQGGNAGMAVLNLWGAATAGGGRLPSTVEMVAQLREAGFAAVEAIRLMPGDPFYAFTAQAAAAN